MLLATRDTTMPNFNDTQTLLLAHAARRDSGAFYPLPDIRNGAVARGATAIARLLSLGLAEEREVSDAAVSALVKRWSSPDQGRHLLSIDKELGSRTLRLAALGIAIADVSRTFPDPISQIPVSRSRELRPKRSRLLSFPLCGRKSHLLSAANCLFNAPDQRKSSARRTPVSGRG